MDTIPFVAFEATCTRLERANRRLFVLCIALLIALLVTNAGWIYYESQYQVVETETQTVTQEADGEGNNRFIGGDYYGTANSDNNEN